MNAEIVRQWMSLAAARMLERKDFLTQLDAAIGDADHGANMERGFTATVERFAEIAGLGPGALLSEAGQTLISTIGGASGALYGTAFLRAGRAAGDADTLDTAAVAAVLEAALAGVIEVGAASEGEKTMVDALAPAARALRDHAASGGQLAEGLAAARAAGEQGMLATIPLQATKGRASYLGERSIGHQDPGATSAAYVLVALEQAVAAGQ